MEQAAHKVSSAASSGRKTPGNPLDYGGKEISQVRGTQDSQAGVGGIWQARVWTGTGRRVWAGTGRLVWAGSGRRVWAGTGRLVWAGTGRLPDRSCSAHLRQVIVLLPVQLIGNNKEETNLPRKAVSATATPRRLLHPVDSYGSDTTTPCRQLRFGYHYTP